MSDSHFSRPGFATWLLVISLSLAAYFKFAPALALAIILAVVCRPFYDWLHRCLDHPAFLRRRPALCKGLASVLTQGLACLCVCLCVLVPLGVLSKNRAFILESAESAYSKAREWSRSEIQAMGGRFQIQSRNDFDELPPPDAPRPPLAPGVPQTESMQEKVVDMVSAATPDLPFALRTLDGAALLVCRMIFFFMALHFFLLHGPVFWADVCSRCTPAWRQTLCSLSKRGRTVLMATCVVHGLSALSAFLLALPVFWIIVGNRHVFLLAMLAGFFQFVPVLGSFTLVAFMTLYFFAAGSPMQAWGCIGLAFPFVVGLPDLLVRPYLSARYGHVHAMTMLVGFVTGFEVFGVLGFVLGPLFLDLIVQFTAQVLGEGKDPGPPAGKLGASSGGNVPAEAPVSA